MKLRAAEKVHYDAGPNMVPLVDIVMVILIFLMLTGTFAVSEHFLQSARGITQRGIGGVVDSKVPLDEPLDIRVDSIGSDSWSAVAGGYSFRDSKAALTQQLTKMREEMNRNNTPTDRIQVVINPGRNTKYKHLVQAYEAALDAQFTKVAFSSAH